MRESKNRKYAFWIGAALIAFLAWTMWFKPSIPITPGPTPTETPTEIPPASNLLLNPSAETLDYWSSYVTPQITANCMWVEDAYDGLKGLRIDLTYNPDASNTESALWYQWVNGWDVGKTYKMRAWYKSDVQASILLLAFDGNGELIHHEMLSLSPSNDWRQSGWVSLTVPSNAVTLRADARLFNRASGYAVFDSFELTEGAPVLVIFPWD